MGAQQSHNCTEDAFSRKNSQGMTHNCMEQEKEEMEIVLTRETKERDQGELSRTYTGGEDMEDEETIEFSDINSLYASSPTSSVAFDESKRISDCFLFPRSPLELVGLASSSFIGSKNILVQPPILTVSSCEDDDEDVEDETLNIESLKEELQAATDTFSITFAQSERSQQQQQNHEVARTQKPINHEVMRAGEDNESNNKISRPPSTTTQPLPSTSPSPSSSSVEGEVSITTEKIKSLTLDHHANMPVALSMFVSRRRCSDIYDTDLNAIIRNEDEDDDDLSQILLLRNNLPQASSSSIHHRHCNLKLPFRRCKRPLCHCQAESGAIIQHSHSAGSIVRDHSNHSGQDHQGVFLSSGSRSCSADETSHFNQSTQSSSSSLSPLRLRLPRTISGRRRHSQVPPCVENHGFSTSEDDLAGLWIPLQKAISIISDHNSIECSREALGELEQIDNLPTERLDAARAPQLPQVCDQEQFLSRCNRVGSNDIVVFDDTDEHDHDDHARRIPRTTNCDAGASMGTRISFEIGNVPAMRSRISSNDWYWTDVKNEDEEVTLNHELVVSGTGSTVHHSQSVPIFPTPDFRRRSRSEDVIDFISDESAALRNPRLNRSRTSSHIFDTPPVSSNGLSTRNSVHHADFRIALNGVQGTDAMLLPLSPTGVAELHTVASTDDSEKHALTPELPCLAEIKANKDISTSALLLKSYRRTIDSYKRQKGLQALISIIQLYHSISWLHYQEGRYDAALCVVNHSLDRFYWNLHSCLTLNETLKKLDNARRRKDIFEDRDHYSSNEALLAEMLITKARILLCLAPSLRRGNNHASNCASYRIMAKELAEIAVSIVEPSMQTQQPIGAQRLESLILAAKGLLMIGKTYSAGMPSSNTSKKMNSTAIGEDGCPKPEIAINYYQHALNLFRYYVASNCSNIPQAFLVQKGHLQDGAYWYSAETLFHIGNLYLSQHALDLAKDAFWEALQLYRYVLHQKKLHGNMPVNIASRNFHSIDVLEEASFPVLDMVSTLTNLGWIHLMEGDLVPAQQSTMEALWFLQNADKLYCPISTNGMIPTFDYQLGKGSFTPPLQHLAVVEYQLGMITVSGGDVQKGLTFFKASLSHQRQYFGIEEHEDIGITMEAMGCAYQQMRAWDKSRTYLEGALKIRRKFAGRSRPRGCCSHCSKSNNSNSERQAFLAVARIQSRLSLSFLELNEHTQARFFLTKAKRRYRHLDLPLDDLGVQTQERLVHAP